MRVIMGERERKRRTSRQHSDIELKTSTIHNSIAWKSLLQLISLVAYVVCALFLLVVVVFPLIGQTYTLCDLLLICQIQSSIISHIVISSM